MDTDIGSVKLKVKSEVLKDVSFEVETKVAKVRNAYERLDGIIRSTGSYWEGDGRVSMYNAYDIRQDDYERMFISIMNHVKNLQEIAGVYELTESTIVSAESMLPGDVIF
ncbi:MAG: hypothetical protein KBS96_05075 [Lachnospiraceae bacterium]|nr:hypothetical protein [Candidatus Colinaster scatohippi]